MNPSRTAEVMALVRALESRRAANERLVDDPIADSFLRPWARAGVSLGRFAHLRNLIERIVDERWPRARTSAVSRTRLFDEAIRRALDEEVRQIVLLGAGFDSRAYRLPGIDRALVFEVDLSADAYRARYFGAAAQHMSGYAFYRASFACRAQ